MVYRTILKIIYSQCKRDISSQDIECKRGLYITINQNRELLSPIIDCNLLPICRVYLWAFCQFSRIRCFSRSILNRQWRVPCNLLLRSRYHVVSWFPIMRTSSSLIRNDFALIDSPISGKRSSSRQKQKRANHVATSAVCNWRVEILFMFHLLTLISGWNRLPVVVA